GRRRRRAVIRHLVRTGSRTGSAELNLFKSPGVEVGDVIYPAIFFPTAPFYIKRDLYLVPDVEAVYQGNPVLYALELDIVGDGAATDVLCFLDNKLPRFKGARPLDGVVFGH